MWVRRRARRGLWMMMAALISRAFGLRRRRHDPPAAGSCGSRGGACGGGCGCWCDVRCVVPGEGTPIQDATCGAGEGDMIYVHEGTNAWECRCGQATYADRRWHGCVWLLIMQRRRRGVGWWRKCETRKLVSGTGVGGGGFWGSANRGG